MNKIKGSNGRVNDICTVKISKRHMRPLDVIGYIEIILILNNFFIFVLYNK
jgi:hypothetical protein